MWIRINFQETGTSTILTFDNLWFFFTFLFIFVLNFGRTFFAFYGTKLFLWLPKWWSYPQYSSLYYPIVISVICDRAQNPKAKSKSSKNSSMQDFCPS